MKCKHCKRPIVQRDIKTGNKDWADTSRRIGAQWTCFTREKRGDRNFDHEPSESLMVLEILEHYEEV